MSRKDPNGCSVLDTSLVLEKLARSGGWGGVDSARWESAALQNLSRANSALGRILFLYDERVSSTRVLADEASALLPFCCGGGTPRIMSQPPNQL